MSSPRRLVMALIGVALMITATGCQADTNPTQGSTMQTQESEMPALPKDEAAAKAVVRRMLMDKALVLLRASGLKYSAAQFDVPISYDDDNAQNGDLSIQFQPCSDAQVQSMTSAIWAHGWKQGGVSHGVNAHQGPLFLQWGKGYGGCRFQITTVNISQHLRMTDDTSVVPELAAFKAVG